MRVDSRWCASIDYVIFSVLFFQLFFGAALAVHAVAEVVVKVRTNTPFSFKAVCLDKPQKHMERKSIFYSIILTCLKSGISQRDKHMQESIGPEKMATLHMLNDFPEWFDGELVLNKVTKGIAGTVNNGSYIFKVRLSDFNIPAKEYLGLRIQDEVEVEVVK